MNSTTKMVLKHCYSSITGEIIPEIVINWGKTFEKFFSEFLEKKENLTCDKPYYAWHMVKLEFIWEYYYRYGNVPESKRKFREFYEQYLRCKDAIDRYDLEYQEKMKKDTEYPPFFSDTINDDNTISSERFNKVKRQYNELQRQYNNIYDENLRLKKELAAVKKNAGARNSYYAGAY